MAERINQITFFASGNGDSCLIEAHGQTIMTDICYRSSDAADEENNEVLDFAPAIRKACDHDRLDLFVLTHPDEDHLRGFGEIFHLGAPDGREEDPDDGDVKLIVDEFWCSSYSADPNYETDASTPVLKEIRRRKRLQGTSEGQKPGNRLEIRTVGDTRLQQYVPNIHWRLLAPNSDEADIPKAPPGQPHNSSNASSLVIQWNVSVSGHTSKVIIAGDAPVEIWERLNRELSEEVLEWHVLLSPHHCSRHSLGRKLDPGTERERFEFSQAAIDALDHPLGANAHVVASSRKFGDKRPPHGDARERYYRILAAGKPIAESVQSRFKCTAEHGRGKKAAHITFRFTALGPALAVAAAPMVAPVPSSAGGGGYGGV